MAATGDNLIETSQLPDSLELSSIDHRECKIVTPEKETLSPTSPLRHSIGNGEDIAKVLNGTHESSEKQSDLKVKVNESGHSDSGLDSSNSSEEGGKFVERQESQIPVDQPESIASPTKRVDGFNFSSGQQALDAVNNNSEVNVEISQVSVQQVRSESVSSECYLGLEIDLHDLKKVDRESKKSVSSDNGVFTETVVHEVNKESDMNLYWYRPNLEIDPSEIEAFKNQNNESHVSSVQMSFGNNYYNNRLEETRSSFDTENKQDEKTSTDDRETRQKWSPAFESASSRFLDLASEMNNGTKPKSDVDIPVEGTDVDSVQQHPWGLDSDNKVLIMPENKVHDDTLPAVAEYVAHQMVVDQVDADVPEADDDIDEADAMGYMEIKDKDKIISSLNSVNNSMQKRYASDNSEQKPIKSQTDATLRMESEQIVSTVVQKVHSTMLKSTSETDSVSQGHDVVDSTNIVMPVEEAIHCVYTETVQATLKDTSVTVPEVYDPMEVRRKFRMPTDVEQKLVALGAKLVAVENLVDEYLDDDDYSLLIADCWLRLRNKRFEMKVNEVSQDAKKSFVYSETKNEMDIKQYLIQKYASKLVDTHHDQYVALDIIVDELGFTEFVTFETVKKSFELDNCKVDLELTNLGDQVCEVEVTVDSPRKVVNALNTVNNLATRLDIQKSILINKEMLRNEGPVYRFTDLREELAYENDEDIAKMIWCQTNILI